MIKSDIRELDGYGFSDMDLIIGSPPCTEFSAPKHVWGPSRGSIPNPQEGVALVKKAEQFISEARPEFWALENIDNMRKWYSPTPIWKFKISVGARRFLWGNLKLPLSPEYRFNHSFGCTREVRLKTGRKSVRDSSRRAEIPYPIARFVADSVKGVAR